MKARYFLGTLEQGDRNWLAAAEVYQALLKASPKQVSVRIPLGVVLWQLDRKQEAEAHFAAVAEQGAKSAALLGLLAKAYLQIGQLDKAEEQWTKALALNPNDTTLVMSLASTQMQQGKTKEALDHYERLLEQGTDTLNVMNKLAWILSTHRSAEVRDEKRALEYAESVARRTGHQSPVVLDALAAALANAGRFDQAIVHGENALNIAVRTGDPRSSLNKAMAERLAAYRKRKPWRQ